MLKITDWIHFFKHVYDMGEIELKTAKIKVDRMRSFPL